MAEKKPKKWIKGAIGRPGALHRHLGIPEGQKIPEERLREAANSKNPTIAKEAHLAMTLKGFHHGAKKRHSAAEMRRRMYGGE